MARKLTLIEYDSDIFAGDAMDPAIQFREQIGAVTGSVPVAEQEQAEVDIAEIERRIEDMRVYARVISSSSSFSSSSSSATPSLVAWWRFESGALFTDSQDSNHWQYDEGTQSSETSDYKEGAGCIVLEPTYSDGLGEDSTIDIADASLSYDFPGQSGNTDLDFTVTFWFKVNHQFATNGLTSFTFAKWNTAATGSFLINGNITQDGDDGSFSFTISNGSFGTQYMHLSDFQTDRWYHAAVAYSPSQYRIRIWDDTAQALLGSDKTGDPVAMSPGNARLYLQGAVAGGDWADAQIQVDDLRVYKAMLDADEIDAIRQGIA